MATIAPTFDNRQGQVHAARENRFFFRLSVFCLIVGVLGFAPTYWLQLAAGTVAVAPMVHLHGAIFTGWLVFLVGQSWLAAEGKLRRHRAWGKVGISLATLVVVVGIGAALQALETRLAAGQGDPARSFLIVSVSSVLGFAGFIVAAMVNVNRSAWHKRFIIVATLSILAAAVARFFFLARNGMQPGLSVSSFPSTPASLVGPIRAQLLVDGVIVFAMVRDWRVAGQVHPAWLWGLAGLLAIQLLKIPIGRTQGWLDFTDWLLAFV